MSPSLENTPSPANTFTADYPSLFGDQGTDRCPDEALESSFGPFAYAESLIGIVRRLEAGVGKPPVKPLAYRRSDIPGLVLDEPALNRRIPRLNLVIECLEAMVESTHPGGEKAAAVLAAATSPVNVPFDRAWALVIQVLRSKRQHPWQLLRQTDEDYPNFSHRAIVSTSMRNALTLCTGLAPAQLQALQTAPAVDEGALWPHLGSPTDSTVGKMADSAAFLQATGLNRKRLRQLLAVNGVAPKDDSGTYTSVVVSKAGNPGGSADSGVFGAYFVNGGQSPALRLVAGDATSKTTRIDNLDAGHLQRIDAMLRLHAGMGLSFAALDRLLQSIFTAQGRTGNFEVDIHALRALGLYRHLRDSRQVSIHAYAAVIDEISPYATGRDTPYYDTLFHAGAGSSDLAGVGAPLAMDDAAFAIDGGDATVQRLSAGLGIGTDTLSVLLEWTVKAQELTAPSRNLAVISACHRLAVLPRWLGHDEKDGLALLRLYEKTHPDLFEQFAGVPALSMVDVTSASDDSSTDEPDIVDAIATLMNLSDWLHRHRLDATSIVNLLGASTLAQGDLARLIQNLSTRTQTVTDGRLRDAFLEMPFAVDAERAPTRALSPLIEDNGIFRDSIFDLDHAALDAQIASALDAVKDTAADSLVTTAAKLERTRHRVGQRLHELLGGQRSLAEQVLAALLPEIADLDMRAGLGSWCGATPTTLLALIDGDGSSDNATAPWLVALRQRSQWVSRLGIDASALDAMRSHREWFDLDDEDIRNPGLIVIHRLVEWNKTVRDVAARSGIEPEKAREDLLSYLGTAGGDTQGDDPAMRLAGVLGVDQTVVASVVAQVSPTPHGGSLTTASHIAWLLRLQALADRTTISVEALLALGRLDLQSSRADIETAAQLLLATSQPVERELIVGTHNEAWRDAMISWLLVHSTDIDGRKFADRNELSAWLLTDLEVGAEPETTRLAAAVDSLQLYIHRLLSGLERHLSPYANIKEERRQWGAYRSRYVDWRQYRERREYPENHIHPARRQRKTGAFLDLETQLSQGQARPADIDTTLLRYLADFERTSNIQVISAYHDGIDPVRDELHLVGRSNIEPYEYFWQSALMNVEAADGHTGMLAWSGWKKIDLPINGELTRTKIPKPPKSSKILATTLVADISAAEGARTKAAELREAVKAAIDPEAAQKAAVEAEAAALKAEEKVSATRVSLAVARDDEDDSREDIETIRPLTIDGRKYLVWVERDTSAIVFDTETAASDYYAMRVCYSYLDTNGNWSASNTLLSLDGRGTDGMRPKPATGEEPGNLFKRSYMPGLIVMENRKGQRETEPYLVTMLFDSQLKADETLAWVADKDYFLAVRDLLLIDEKRLDGTSKGDTLEKRLVRNWFNLYRDPRVVQHPYIGAKHGLKASAEKPAVKIDDARLAELRKKFVMITPEKVDVRAELTRDGSEIQITGSFDSEWRSSTGTQREIESVDGIDSVIIDHTIDVHLLSKDHNDKVNKDGGTIVAFKLQALVSADSWTRSKVIFSGIEITSNNLAILTHLKDIAGKTFRDANEAAILLLEHMVPGLDVSTKSLSIDANLVDLLRSKDSLKEIKTYLMSWHPSGFFYESLESSSRAIPFVLQGKPVETDQDRPTAIPVSAGLIRAANAKPSGLATTDATLLADLKSSDGEGPQALQALHALATSGTDRAALTAWLPVLADTWHIPARDYYEALRKEGLEYGVSDGSSLSGSLPFLQAMQATSRPSLRSALVRCVADTLGATLPEETRAKLSADLRNALVLFAARENTRYRDFLARLARYVAGSDADVVIKTETMNAYTRGIKRIVARIPVDADETDYTFRLVLKTAADPLSGADVEYHEWIRITAPYTLTNITEANTQLPDDRVPTARLRRNRAQAQYLDLDESGLPPIRLNTLFGKQLVARAERSVDAALSIDAQTLPEPALRAGASGGFVDFRGANGLHFWELFFHVPWLVAWSLCEKAHYGEAWRWCSRYLFDPYRGRTTETTAPVPFWNCLPLVYPLDGARNTGEAPELAGYENAIHFRKAIHAFLVDVWRMEGDEQFRRMTIDSLREANLCYQKALQLIGTLPEPAESRPWTPTMLGSRKASFVKPVNRALRDRRSLLQARMDNLRHGRTIDGVRIPYLGYGDEDEGSGWSGGRRGSTSGLRMLSLGAMPVYRFREVMVMALAAVERLTELGRYLFRIYEHEADNALDVERQRNLLALADFDISLRRKAVETARRERNSLRLTQEAIKDRIQYFTGQLAYPRSGLEIAGSVLATAGVLMQYARYVPIAVGGGLKSIPKIFGFSVGGQDVWGPAEAIDKALEVTSEGNRLLAEDLRMEASYDRRNEEWAHDKSQAQHDLAILTSQLDEQISRAEASAIELNEAIKRRDHLRSEFEVQTTGFAIASTYTWMLGRLGELFASCYQSVLALCLDAQASYHYETGDFDSRHVRLDAWEGARRGMFAGEALQNDLHALQGAYLHRHVRRLQIHRTISLRSLLGDAMEAQLNTGKLHFSLDTKLFDADFPGHYLRQIRRVAIVLVPKADATGLHANAEIRAVLTQSSNTLLYRPAPEGAEHLYDPDKGDMEAIVRDLRGDQQVVLSHASPRPRADPMETIMLRAEHADGRYGPFEGTGAISSWTLVFPGDKNDSKLIRDEIEDVEIHLDYSSAWGGTEFKEKVDNLLASRPSANTGRESAESTPAPPPPVTAAPVPAPTPTPAPAPAPTVAPAGPGLSAAPTPRLDEARKLIERFYRTWEDVDKQSGGDLAKARSLADVALNDIMFYAPSGVAVVFSRPVPVVANTTYFDRESPVVMVQGSEVQQGNAAGRRFEDRFVMTQTPLVVAKALRLFTTPRPAWNVPAPPAIEGDTGMRLDLSRRLVQFIDELYGTLSINIGDRPSFLAFGYFNPLLDSGSSDGSFSVARDAFVDVAAFSAWEWVRVRWTQDSNAPIDVETRLTAIRSASATPVVIKDKLSLKINEVDGGGYALVVAEWNSTLA
ncbi:hypothetical protein QFZ41_002421 [Luteibacter sp. W1I16]|uniref:Tc toxin subunit A-related protein n=1 Tax=Luteibacter sp. W1I16 TaxID=3373922 RepID=UPI003D1DD134